jgi:hypothetical protein
MIMQNTSSKTLIPLWLLALLSSLVTSKLASGSPVAPLNVDALLAHSDVVIVGKVSDLSHQEDGEVEVEGKKIPVAWYSAQVIPLRTIKGVIQLPIILKYPLPYAGMGFRGIPANKTRLLFLRKTKEGYVFTNRTYPSLPAAFATPPIPDIIPPNTSTPIQQIEVELYGSISGAESEQDQTEAVRALAVINDASADVLLRKVFASTGSDIVKLQAASDLLLKNDIEPIGFAGDVLLRKIRPTAPQFMIRNLSAAIENGVKDPRAIPILQLLLLSEIDDVTRAAAFALRNTAERLREVSLLHFQVKIGGPDILE